MYDIESLKYDLISYLLGGIGVNPAITLEIEELNKATDEDIIRIAISYGIDIEDYRKKDRTR